MVLAQGLLWAQSPWSPAPVAYSLIRPKSHISNIGHDGTLSFRNVIMMVKKIQESQFWAYFVLRPWSGQSPKIGHDGILSIGNFILMIKNHILLFQLPGNWPTTKKCAPYFRGNTEFPIYLFIWALNFEQLRKLFSQVFKMAVIFKMGENWFFDHNSVSFELFCVLFCVFGLIGHISYNNFFVTFWCPRWRSKLKWELWDMTTFLHSVFCIYILTSNMTRALILPNKPNMVDRSKMADQNQFC
jgi:hypothetical protein